CGAWESSLSAGLF
nr:immunoglobulin light chain junction region [Macaca mulatta]